jgi:hypothetical protein
MRKATASCLVVLLVASLALLMWGQVPYVYQTPLTIFTTVTTSVGYHIAGTGAANHQLSWSNTGVVSTCQIQIDSSADGVTWNSGDVVPSTLCTTSGTVTSSAHVVNFVRINVTAISGTAFTVSARITGLASSGTGGSTVTNIFNITNFGAVAGQDSTTALQNAINAACSNGGGTVVAPAGTFKISNIVTWGNNCSNVFLTGQGFVATIFQVTASGTPFLNLNPSGPTISDGGISNLAITRTVAVTGNAYGIKVNSVQRFDFNNILMEDCNLCFQSSGGSNNRVNKMWIGATLGTVGTAFDIENGNSLYLNDCVTFGVSFAVTNAINEFNAAADVWYTRFNVGASGGDVILAAGVGATQDTHFISAIIEPASSAAAIQISGANGNNCGLNTPCGIIFVDAHVANTAGPDITITNSQGVFFSNSDIRCLIATNCVQVTGATSGRNNFSNNNFRSEFTGASPTSLLQISSAGTGNIVVGNTFVGTSSFPFGTAIAVTGTLQGVIGNNSFTGNGTTAISLDATSNNWNMCGNQVDTTAITNKFTNAGAGNVCGVTN